MTPDDRIDLAERIERRAERLRDGGKPASAFQLEQLAAEIRDGSFWENDDD